MAATVDAPSATPYWAEKPNIAPIKSSYVIWDRIIGGRVVDGKPSPAATATEEKVAEPRELDDDDAAEGRPNASSSKGAVSDLTRSTEEPPRKKHKGQNKGRQFARIQDGGLKLCSFTARGEPCARLQDGLTCDLNHDIKIYLQEQKKADIQTEQSGESDSQYLQSTCPIYSNYGACPFGFKCRFSTSHMDDLPEGEGFQGSGKALSINWEKLRQACPHHLSTDDEKLQWLYRTRGEMNVVTPSRIAELRRIKTQDLPKTRAYLISIGEPMDTRAAMGKHKGKGNNRQKGNKGGDDKTNGEAHAQEAVSLPDASTETPLRPVEKKRLNFEGKLYLAPLTTVGNLPFRRLCVGYGADITCGEMGLAQEFLSGNKNEWSLVRRHPSEKCFGIQLCGNKPQTLVSATEQIKSECPDLDFIDVNMGCPIDLVVKKGGGSALLESGSKVGKILGGMNVVANETLITIKMRTGIKTGVNTTHKLMSRVVRDWGVGALTIHGRSQQQRYTKLADYEYIKTCADELRYRADELDMPAVPIFGNGDAYDHRSYWENVESSGVDGIMIARGALIKPWLFTEIKERRDWDISSRERLDMIGNLASYGLEHWGSDTVGVNTTRRFMCEALSFQYRYVPVGILERLPARLNDRPYPFNGRDGLESLLASDNYMDWIKITSMFLGPPDEDFQFVPKHKSNAYDNAEQANG